MNQQQMVSEQQAAATFLPYGQTGYYSKTILDYLEQSDSLRPFYQHDVSIAGIKAAIEERKSFAQNRDVLVSVLKEQYNNIAVSEAVRSNIDALSQPDTFTITTAHQPVIFTGPLYFAYKILHTVKLAETLHNQLPQHRFVPVFYMGSEDADLDELGTIQVDGKTYKWQTTQTGAVGRMTIDHPFLNLLQQLENQISVLEWGEELVQIFKRCYRAGNTIQQATLEVVNELFGAYGVVVLIPDHPSLKRLIEPVLIKEISEQFSHQQVEATLSEMSKLYKVQAGGREINLFYLVDNHRERFEKEDDRFTVPALNLQFTKEELIAEIKTNPERFSPNVILRGVLQETILPNLAFIGGGGELAYWLELKQVFAAAGVPYPVLILRNSYLLLTKDWNQKIKQLGFTAADFFKDSLFLINELVAKTTVNKVSIVEETEQLLNIFHQLQSIATQVDVSLREHVAAVTAQTEKKLVALQKKIQRAERRKYQTQHQQIEMLKAQLFPNGSLQERKENISGWYGRYGNSFLQTIYDNALSMEQEFVIVTL